MGDQKDSFTSLDAVKPASIVDLLKDKPGWYIEETKWHNAILLHDDISV